MGGIDILRLGSYQGGIYADSKPTTYAPIGWGLRLAILWGPLNWAIPKVWKKEAWSRRWDEGNTWFTIKLPLFAFPLISFGVKKIGFYVGVKQNGWGDNSCLLLTARMTKNRRI